MLTSGLDCKVLFTSPKIGKRDNTPVLVNSISSTNQKDSSLEKVVIVRGDYNGLTTYNDLMSEGASLPPEETLLVESLVNTHDVCNLQFTSGSTGNPKAAMLTHQ
jgi:mevalonyl-CoA ligase